MQTFYMIIGKERLYLYEKENSHYGRQYVGGNPEFCFDINNARRDINELKEILVNEFNLDTSAQLEFIVVDNEDEIVSKVMGEALGEYAIKKYEVIDVICDIVTKLRKDKKLLIDEYGINFDGKNYLIINGKVKKRDFDLLGYTLSEDNLMKYIG